MRGEFHGMALHKQAWITLKKGHAILALRLKKGA